MTGIYTISIRPARSEPMPIEGQVFHLIIPGAVEIYEHSARSRYLALRLAGADSASVLGARIGHALAFLEGETDHLPASVIGAGEAFGARV